MKLLEVLMFRNKMLAFEFRFILVGLVEEDMESKLNSLPMVAIFSVMMLPEAEN